MSKTRQDARFLVCGGELPGYEAYASGLRRLAKDLGIEDRVLFTEWTYRLDDIPEVMASLDVLVHTSIRPEPFGLVIVEAMATAKPVVAADDGGVREVVEPGVTALLARPGDHLGVAKAVLEILSDPSRAAAMGQGGRARAEKHFEVGAYVRRVEAVYDELLRYGRPPMNGRLIHGRPTGFKGKHVAAVLGLRPPVAEHTEAEAELLGSVAAGRRRLVEVGVGEGGSAVLLRSVMAEDGELYLVDPYVRRPSIQMTVARRAVGGVRRGRVTWSRSYSLEAAAKWVGPIDFLHLDADHRYEAVRADWEAWTPHVAPGGMVAMHDARPVPGIDPLAGPIRLAAEIESAGGSWSLASEAGSTVVFRRLQS